MAQSRKFLTAGALGVASLALVGAGASATYFDAVTGQQEINGGDLKMTISSTAEGSSTDGNKVTLPPVGPVNSTFSTGAQRLIVTNSGAIDAKVVNLVVEDASPRTRPNAALQKQVWVKIVATLNSARASRSPVDIYNGPLSALVGKPFPITDETIAEGEFITTDVTYYAGSGDAPSLTDSSERGVVTPTFKVDFEG